MERPQLVGLVVGVSYPVQFQGGAEKKVGLCFDIDLLTGLEEGNCSTKGTAASLVRWKARSRTQAPLDDLTVVGSRLEDLRVDYVSQLQG
jgi:hypothetical protein